ncbi:hypothetical protein H4J46_16045 [Colwellia sp. MB02u-6]|uniref:hypothetical protein n=1 Tax=Colwellia sp. MB02u-6 TaxID=2759824 RepID=UPI0015F43898|nr:hypothetical protein [Colwellia sp. MB02u-6]MBA6329439.1 hypothetical protein [Colwellia sp. MB02u-6]
MKYSKLFIATASLLFLNGCLDYNDDSKDVVQAINAQTAVISEQQTSEASVTFHGVVVDSFDDQPVISALITVYLGTETVVDGLIAINGVFEIATLPANSDIEVIISSNNEQFSRRAFFLNTGASTANVAIKDFGTFAVSEPQEVQISVLNSVDNSSVENLEFSAYSHVGSSSSTLKYKHTSTYDAVNGQYNITLPKHINTSVSAGLDFNRDGKVDLIPEYSNNLMGTDLYINSANSIDVLTVYVADNNDAVISDVEYRISILDSAANSIPSAELVIEDENNAMLKSVYDATTEQHVVLAKFSQQISLNMPAFSANGIHYQSASIRLYQQSEEELEVSISGTYQNCCYSIPNSDTMTLVLLPRVTSNVSALEVVTKSQEIDSVNSIFKVFYSQGVSIPNASVSLVRTSGFTTVKGNDDSNDLILPGATLFTGGFNIATSHTVTLNNTKLEVIPESVLVLPGSYHYNVGNVEVISTEEVTDINDDSLFFTITNPNQTFDITDVKLDNENFTTKGIAITTVNTANEASTSSNSDRSVYFYLPASIHSLKNFTMRQLSITKDNVVRTDARSFTFINNGNVNNSRVGTVKLAENEVIVRDRMQVTVYTGTAQDDSQAVYRMSNYEYMSDNTPSSKNTISFEYAYETIAGDISTGAITIPVQ